MFLVSFTNVVYIVFQTLTMILVCLGHISVHFFYFGKNMKKMYALGNFASHELVSIVLGSLDISNHPHIFKIFNLCGNHFSKLIISSCIAFIRCAMSDVHKLALFMEESGCRIFSKTVSPILKLILQRYCCVS